MGYRNPLLYTGPDFERPPAGPAKGSEEPAPSNVILVVEDDPDLRPLAAEALRNAGLETVEAENADEALRMLNRRNDIRTLMTDIEMPGSLDGLGLAEIVRHRWPLMRIVITSGRYDQPATLPGNMVFLPKPYLPHDLIYAVRGCVNYRA